MSTMFRATKSAQFIFRGSITSKRGNKNFYKGRGAPSMGYFAKHGKYLIDREKYARHTFAVPSLKNFPLKPYVAVHAPKRAVARPKMIVNVDFKSKIQVEKQLRLAKMVELKALFKSSTKGASARKQYASYVADLTAFNNSRANHYERQALRAETRSNKIKLERARKAKEEKRQQLDAELKAFKEQKAQNPDLTIKKRLQAHQENREGRKFREFLASKAARKNMNVIKKAAAQQQAV